MTGGPLRARVFISCGQSSVTGEAEIAGKIHDQLSELGFEPYVAVDEQTLRGIQENIFDRLRKCEYFLFVDFKREMVVGTESKFYRGSLFSHQELAIASFLDIGLVAFQEADVKREGLIAYLQANAIPFTDKRAPPNEVGKAIRQKGWDSNWRNELVLEASEPVETGTAKAFHVRVQNRHREKHASNCCAYLEKVIKRPAEEIKIPGEIVELKWAASQSAGVNIPASKPRRFDAF